MQRACDRFARTPRLTPYQCALYSSITSPTQAKVRPTLFRATTASNEGFPSDACRQPRPALASGPDSLPRHTHPSPAPCIATASPAPLRTSTSHTIRLLRGREIDEDGWDDRKIDELAALPRGSRGWSVSWRSTTPPISNSASPSPKRRCVCVSAKSRARAPSTTLVPTIKSRGARATCPTRASRPTRRRPSRRQRRLPRYFGPRGSPAAAQKRPAHQRQSGLGRRGATGTAVVHPYPNPTRRGFPIPSADVQAIRATLPSRDQCERYFDAYFAHYNWARLPLHEATLRDRFRQFVAGVPSPSDVRMDAETLPFVALVLAILTLGSVPPIVQPAVVGHIPRLLLGHQKGARPMRDARSRQPRLVLGTRRPRSLSRRDPRHRASWHEIGSWIRDALDLGLHRDGSSFGLPKEQVAARRILWSHVITTIASGASSSAVRSPSPFTTPKCPRATGS